jgi:uncharacterized protein
LEDFEMATAEVKTHHQVCDGHLYKWLIAAGLAWLEHNRDRVNQLNVFPVPDGDTGTNMWLTIKRAYEEVAQMNDPHIGRVSNAVSRGALMGARGNSGVILSQLLRGFGMALEHESTMGPAEFARACASAKDMSYKAVITPVEGTILTVARLAADAVVEAAKTEQSVGKLLDIMIEAAWAALKTTPDLLPILKKAGVVDSGGQGLVYIIEGMQRLVRGEIVSMVQGGAHGGAGTENWQDALTPEDEEGYGYDVQFLIHGESLNIEKVRADIDAMGWSTLVVGDEKLIKVHVHVHNPGVPISYAIEIPAAISDIVVENMQMQYHGYVEQRENRESGAGAAIEGVAVITVAAGDGLHKLFTKDLQAASVVSGGQTMNPSAEDFLQAIDKLPNTEIILLPNNKNILMAARQAASLARDKQVRVVASRTIQQGIAAMFAYGNGRENAMNLEEIVEEMNQALPNVKSCEVTNAVRNVEFDGILVEEGNFIGMLDGTLVCAGKELSEVITVMLNKADAKKHELITLYYGEGLSESQAQGLVDYLAQDFNKQDIQIAYGGQPLYPYLISIE